MTSKELIARLRDVDPSGEKEVYTQFWNSWGDVEFEEVDTVDEDGDDLILR